MNASPPDGPDALYRRFSNTDSSRPSDATRQNILSHAAQKAAQNSPQPRRATRYRSRYAAFATLAAAAFAGLMVVPHFLRQPPLEQPPAAANVADALDAASRARGKSSPSRASLAPPNAVDPNALDAHGHTALMLAILQDDIAGVDALLSQGADAALKDADGTTPLQAATLRGNSAIIHSLRKALQMKQ